MRVIFMYLKQQQKKPRTEQEQARGYEIIWQEERKEGHDVITIY